MPAVDAVILHPPVRPEAGPLERALSGARATLAEEHVRGFRAVGADTVRVVSDDVDEEPFGTRVRRLVRALAEPGSPLAGSLRDATRTGRGLVLLGSGSLALATRADRARFVEAARGPGRRALANNRFSADAIALTSAAAASLTDVPAGLPGDNALPRWLAEVAHVEVTDLRGRWRLALDLDSPLDPVLLSARDRAGREELADGEDPWTVAVTGRIAELRSVLADRRAEVVLAGRSSAGTIAWLERRAACRVRALLEERGLRASSRLALSDTAGTDGPAGRGPRPPRSVLGLVLDRDGPGAIGPRLSELGDGAAVDTRVLLAHRLGADETAWPPAEDRFASDLLLPERIADPWLRELTESALRATIPIVLGGHTLVGPGIRLLTPRLGA